jgi:hypothetical protein
VGGTEVVAGNGYPRVGVVAPSRRAGRPRRRCRRAEASSRKRTASAPPETAGVREPADSAGMLDERRAVRSHRHCSDCFVMALVTRHTRCRSPHASASPAHGAPFVTSGASAAARTSTCEDQRYWKRPIHRTLHYSAVGDAVRFATSPKVTTPRARQSRRCCRRIGGCPG